MGLAFAFGWTPCLGPVLGAILAVAGSSATVEKGALLLAVYSAGLGVPFLLAALAVRPFLGALRHVRRFLPVLEKVMGALLVAYRHRPSLSGSDRQRLLLAAGNLPFALHHRLTGRRAPPCP